ncbi:sigma-70 family RNA polymerase sigma factor [Brevibacillus borstelensis]|uniref:sigma-70 family RNA polymerase sigma factor n=1 Tax=Brevibacillus borstelensis TaxID=45462 RepID=UPI000F0872F9|nr:sigma-70 family RNA polymerase sigma factor [Brevibacillus borstelensis]MED1881992.1 sigma-70 family RNA polymerase sigma factor [Brevibacillus borstelensis]RNB56104.1 sigma-70 family RNA polymerase sigma factor [Brevibacillus borstelensis]GED55572.1 positive control factor [Brevibacillus borstelensis]
MHDLLKGYKETWKGLNAAYEVRRAASEAGNAAAIAERQLIGEMRGEVEWIIEWLESGRRPGNKRGIERRAAYQREKLMDPIKMQAYVARSTAGSPANLTEWEMQQIEDALCVLSERERECYVLAHGECFSYEAIADLLGISKSSVATHIKRAQAKISERLMNSLFLVG